MDENYWPYPLRDLQNENPLASKQVIVAEISSPWDSFSAKKILTALAPKKLVKKILENPGGIGTEVSTTGPHPSTENYIPKFSIWAGGISSEGLEPLVVSWRTGSKTVLLPDQGFLMTYGLVPRTIKSEDGDTIHWDDLERPFYDVVISKTVSEYYYELKSEAKVSIDDEYLQDYATLRNRALVQVFYTMNSDDLVPKDIKALLGKESQEYKFKGRHIVIRIDHRNKSKLNAQVWGVKLLYLPKNSPITQGRWNFGKLIWPGIEEPVTIELSRKLGLKYVYVDDSVLQYYEEHPDKYTIYPESGSVSYGAQWSVSYCQRVSRNLIQIEIKKLYEGCPPEVVKHWHDHAVAPPEGITASLMKELNVAIRAKKIVYSLVDLGDLLAQISNKIKATENFTSEDFTGLSRSTLNYFGWWADPNVLPITKHIKKDMSEESFLERCKSLNSLIVEGLNEKKLRQKLLSIGLNRLEIEKFKALKLLDIIIQFSFICRDTGLDLFKEPKEIERRWLEKKSILKKGQNLKTPIDVIFLLNDLRIANAHRGRKMDGLLERLGTDRASVSSDMGGLLDRLYDLLGEALQNTIESIRNIL